MASILEIMGFLAYDMINLTGGHSGNLSGSLDQLIHDSEQALHYSHSGYQEILRGELHQIRRNVRRTLEDSERDLRRVDRSLQTALTQMTESMGWWQSAKELETIAATALEGARKKRELLTARSTFAGTAFNYVATLCSQLDRDRERRTLSGANGSSPESGRMSPPARSAEGSVPPASRRVPAPASAAP